MKIAISVLALALAQDDISELRKKVQEIRKNRDGNPTIIEQALQTYYSVAGDDNWQDAGKLLQYGCYCQILNNDGRHGMGEPVDALDE